MDTEENSALAKYAARVRWHPTEANAQRERAEEVARVAKQATDEYLPSDKHDLMLP
jgi:hypothetical protein